MSNEVIVSAKDMTQEQLAAIEAGAIKRYWRMWSGRQDVGKLTIAVAAILLEMFHLTHPETNWYVVADEHTRNILKGYLARWKLTSAFPFKNAQLLDFVEHSNLQRVFDCFVG